MNNEELVTVMGGLRARFDASWPLVTLAISHDSISLTPSFRPLRFFMPTYSFALEEIRSIEVVTKRVSGDCGIQFTLNRKALATHRWGAGLIWPKERQRLTFWVLRRDRERTLAALPQELIGVSPRRI
jgi:hypothetical protein